MAKDQRMKPLPLKILVVEDNEDLLEATLVFFKQQGHTARGVVMAEEINDALHDFLPDVYVIDLNLPDEDGLSLTRRIRDFQPNVGIVITTARSQIGDKVLGYNNGADLYLTKPVHPKELMAGIESLGKRMSKAKPTHEQLSLHVARRVLSGCNGAAELTTGEATVLVALARAPGLKMERWQLMELIGTAGNAATPASLEMRIARLRKKLDQIGADAPSIQSIHKTGYVLCQPILLSN